MSVLYMFAAWHHLVQGSMCIGVACSLIGMAIITNSIEGKILTMTVTVHRTCACVLGISGECPYKLWHIWVVLQIDKDEKRTHFYKRDTFWLHTFV